MAHALARARQGRYLAPPSRDLLRPCHGRAGADPSFKGGEAQEHDRPELEVAELLAARGRPFLTAAELSPTSPIRPSIAQFSQGK